MGRKIYKCQNCGEVTTYHREGLPCGYCGNFSVVLLNKNAISFNNYQNLTGSEKEAIKTFIVNSLSEFRSKNISLIQQNWQLLTPALLLGKIWNSVAMSVINPSSQVGDD